MNKKFRIWNIFDEKWECADKFSIVLSNSQVLQYSLNKSINLYEWREPLCHYVIQQWTGLLDRNGREIYEGDIVLYINGQSKHEVVSCIGGFKINYLNLKRGVLVGAFCETNGKTESLEVLTNIFENHLDNPSTKD